MRFFSQHGEDRWLFENDHLPEHGYFVDVGAFDGVNLSNTMMLEEMGWSGIGIEADPRSWVPLLRNRKCDVFLGAAAGQRGSLEFDCTAEPSHSGVGRNATSSLGAGGTIRVPALRLSDIIAAYTDGPYPTIDLLSLDTEGTELEVWGSGGFTDYAGEPRPQSPWIVVIEWETAGLPSKENEIQDHFGRLSYEQIHRTVGNLIFKRTY